MASKPSIESALLRRFGQALLHPGFRQLSHDRLMEASHECLSQAATSDDPETRIVALRLHENPRTYESWACEHSGMMRNVAAERSPAAQRESMLSASFSLIQRKAMFEYLRERQVRGTKREALIQHFFPQRDVADSMRVEHMQYVRSTASYLCVEHVGRDLMSDPLFEEPLAEYEVIYHEYFYAYCDQIVADGTALSMPMEILGGMKNRVSEWRKALLALTHSQSGTWRRPKF
ncbi:MAG TPA: hypothetical protein VJS42_13320 [Steroidobacteraceae bacterium]|nr:hypothetical protein [Steroidobacteraceae bacterium]